MRLICNADPANQFAAELRQTAAAVQEQQPVQNNHINFVPKFSASIFTARSERAFNATGSKSTSILTSQRSISSGISRAV
jgi:hypothetical protein